MRREEYLDAIMDAIRELGPGASLGDLATAAGMSKPVLYDHFTDRRGLTAAVAAKVFETETAAARVAVLTAGEPRELIASAVEVFVGFVEREPQLYAWLIRGARGLPGSFVGPHLAQARNRLSTVLGPAMRSAGVGPGGVEPIVLGVLGLIMSAADWWLVRGNARTSRGDFVNHLTDFVWGGIMQAGVQRIDPARAPAAASGAVDSPRTRR